jgi:hypothetical protein
VDLTDRKLLTEDYETDLVVELIFGHMLYQLMSYLYLEDITFDQVCEQIKTGINFIMAK